MGWPQGPGAGQALTPSFRSPRKEKKNCVYRYYSLNKETVGEFFQSRSLYNGNKRYIKRFNKNYTYMPMLIILYKTLK